MSSGLVQRVPGPSLGPAVNMAAFYFLKCLFHEHIKKKKKEYIVAFDTRMHNYYLSFYILSSTSSTPSLC